MSATITIDIQDGATPELRAKFAALTPQRIYRAISGAVLKLTQSNFLTLPSNKMGWPSTGFWKGAYRATTVAPDPQGVMLSVNQIGVGQQWRGGEILPVKGKALTIPMAPQAYGHTASFFPGIFCLRTKAGAFLVIGKEPDLVFLYRLSPGVTQKPNARVMPTVEAYATTAKEGILRAWRTAQPGKAGTPTTNT